MTPGEWQECSWTARGWEVIFFFVCCLYASTAALKKMDSKSVDDMAVDGTRDIVLVEGA